MDIREMVRRLRKRQSRRAIAKALNVNRKTVRRYRVWAQEHGLLEGNLPSLPDLLTLGDFGLKPLQFCPHCLRLRQQSGPVSNYVYVREVATPCRPEVGIHDLESLIGMCSTGGVPRRTAPRAGTGRCRSADHSG